MEIKHAVIGGFILFIIGIIVFFSAPIIFVQSLNPFVAVQYGMVGGMLAAVGFFTFVGSLIYMRVKGRKS